MKYVTTDISPTINIFLAAMSMIAIAEVLSFFPGSLKPVIEPVVTKIAVIKRNIPIQFSLKVVKKIQKPK
jgi:hypothetical protein